MAEPVDEFEFKPLTEGLGFHKKAENSAPAARASMPLSVQLSNKSTDDIFSRPLDSDGSPLEDVPVFALSESVEDELLGREPKREHSQSISDLIASLPPSLDFLNEKEEGGLGSSTVSDESPPQIFQSLAREEYKPQATVTPPTPSMSAGVLPPPGTKVATATTVTATTSGATSAFRSNLDESYAKAFPHLERRKEIRKSTEIGGLQAVACNLGAGVLDAMVVTGISTILLVCILMITQVNLVGLLSNAQTDGPTQMHLGLLFIAVLQLYMMTARSFGGASLGEWAFELQLGSDEDRNRAVYPLLVAWRMILVTATGIVVLPLLSLVFGRDLAKYLGGLQLYRRP